MISLVDFLECEMGASLTGTPLAVVGIGNPTPPMDGHDGSEPLVFNRKASKDKKKHEKNRRTMEKEKTGTQGI